ncbi:MAG: hypothetical protein ABI315_03690 [Bacteroidia bacterium]
MNSKLLLSFLMGLLSLAAQGKYVQTCNVKYKQREVWSTLKEIQVTFMSGSELNEEKTGFAYSTYDSYAIISWSEGEVITIKLSENKCGILIESPDCSYSDFHSLYDNGYVTGSDKEEKEWKICYNNDCN